MSPRIVATLQAEDAAARLREEAAHHFRADVTDKVLLVAQVKPLEVAHRYGNDLTVCGRSVWLFEEIPASKAIEFVMQPCADCHFEEHRYAPLTWEITAEGERVLSENNGGDN